MAALTARGKDQRWLTRHRGITENPANSNWDRRQDGIAAAIRRCGFGFPVPWCGVWTFNALQTAGVKGISSRQASVALIEEDARHGRGPFRDWRLPAEWRKVLRGDLVVLFGRGVHVETVRGFKRVRGVVYVITDGGNTSSGNGGSQSNGGGSYRRVRPLRDAWGFARVDYPGGRIRARLAKITMRLSVLRARPEIPSDATIIEASDRLLLAALDNAGDSPLAAGDVRAAL